MAVMVNLEVSKTEFKEHKNANRHDQHFDRDPHCTCTASSRHMQAAVHQHVH